MLCPLATDCPALPPDTAVPWAVEAQVLGLQPAHSTPYFIPAWLPTAPLHLAMHGSRQVSTFATTLHSHTLLQSDYAGTAEAPDTRIDCAGSAKYCAGAELSIPGSHPPDKKPALQLGR